MIQVLVVEDSRITRDAIESQIAKSEKYVFSSLSKGKTYQFRVRPATPSYEWETRYGKWSNTFTYKVK